MTIIDDKIRDEKLHYNIKREAAKISALSSGKIDKNEYLICEEIVPFNQRQIVEKAWFAYSPLGKAFEKQTEKQVDAIKSLDPSNKSKQIEGIFSQNLMNDLIRAKLKEIVELQDFINKDDVNYKSKGLLLGLLFSARVTEQQNKKYQQNQQKQQKQQKQKLNAKCFY